MTPALPATRAQIAARIPHQGARCNPLRREGQLSAVMLCEYGAQAMAVHGGIVAHAAGSRPPAGWLVALREVQLTVASVEADGELEVVARRLAASDDAPSRWVGKTAARELTRRSP